MSNRDPDTHFYKDRWSATSAPASGTTAVAASPTPAHAQERQNLEMLWYSIWNSNAAATVTVSVRVASQAGTVLASIDHQVLTSTVVSAALFGMGLPGKRGRGFAVTMSTTIASLTQKVNIAGWTDTSSG